MTNSTAPTAAASSAAPDNRPYSPGLEGVLAGETSLSRVDGANCRLIYRGYRIGDLVEHGTYPAVANLLWTGDWDPAARMATAPVPDAVLATLRALPKTARPRPRRVSLRGPFAGTIGRAGGAGANGFATGSSASSANGFASASLFCCVVQLVGNTTW